MSSVRQNCEYPRIISGLKTPLHPECITLLIKTDAARRMTFCLALFLVRLMHKRHTIMKIDGEQVARDKKNREVPIFSEQQPQLPGCQNRGRRWRVVRQMRCLPLVPADVKRLCRKSFGCSVEEELVHATLQAASEVSEVENVAYFVTSKPCIVGERIRVANTVTRASSLCAQGVAEWPYAVSTRQHCTFRHAVRHRLRCKNVLWVEC